MTVATEERPSPSLLPVRYEPAPTGKRPRYEPKHALPRARKDHTHLWLWLLLIVTSGFVAGTTAAFNATVGDTTTGNRFGTVSLAPPASQTLTLAGSNMSMAVGSLGGLDDFSSTAVGVRWYGYYPTTVQGVSMTGSPPTCSTASSPFLPANGGIDLAGSSTTQSPIIAQPTFLGRWLCVMSFTTYPADPAITQRWISQISNPRGPMQLGHVVQSVTLSNGGNAQGTIQANDTITVLFNQAVDPATRPTSGDVCARTDSTPANRLFIGFTGRSCNKNQTEATLGALDPINGATLSASTTWTATWAWGADDRTLTITLGGPNTATINGCATAPCFQLNTSALPVGGATNLQSSASPKLALCTAQPVGPPDGGVCFPNANGRF